MKALRESGHKRNQIPWSSEDHTTVHSHSTASVRDGPSNTGRVATRIQGFTFIGIPTLRDEACPHRDFKIHNNVLSGEFFLTIIDF